MPNIPIPEEPTTMFVGCANETCAAVLSAHRDIVMQELSIQGWAVGREGPGMLCPRCLAEDR
jgi:hypothetical protein